MTIQEELFALQDTEYAAFQSKLTPTVPSESIIGVRVPQLRKLAKKLFKSKEAQEFLLALPHTYYDENMLHSLLISEIKDFDACVLATDAFLPFVDNWTVCDILSPRVFKKTRERLTSEILRWTASIHAYTCRFGIEMLMTHFLDDDFEPKYLEIPAQVHSDEYYVNMMVAWFFATALVKQWDFAIPYLETEKLDTWTHNKTIQKARESYRITKEQKLYLKSLKR
ncbi:DNA alkylation repair protein [Lancefieldella sp. Marseille-Q7238]|uniref:DNA alkylation repair protein n=1 Tax=Lancefieldella sp. Marseille-Q7238 TaxID=3022127 RepID=UPI0024A83CD2|nr:DNA alkylation repair protein [Lancefieldella sp. Marseille-Q7238]